MFDFYGANFAGMVPINFRLCGVPYNGNFLLNTVLKLTQSGVLQVLYKDEKIVNHITFALGDRLAHIYNIAESSTI